MFFEGLEVLFYKRAGWGKEENFGGRKEFESFYREEESDECFSYSCREDNESVAGFRCFKNLLLVFSWCYVYFFHSDIKDEGLKKFMGM